MRSPKYISIRGAALAALLCAASVWTFAVQTQAVPVPVPSTSSDSNTKGLVGAAPVPGGELSLEQAVALAVEHDPAVLRARQALKTAEALRLQAEARPDPSLVLETGGIPFDFKKDDDEEIEFSFGVEQTFEFPGKRSLRSRIGRFGEDLARLELDRAARLASASVKRAYFKAAAADKNAVILGDSIRQLDAFIESVRLKYDSGAALYGDLLRARVERARLENQLIEERMGRDEALSALNLIMGRPSQSPAELTTPIVFAPPGGASLEALREDVLNSSASLKLAAIRSEQAGTAVKLAALNRRPDLILGLYAPSKRLSGWGFSLGVSLPLSRKRTEGLRLEASSAASDSALASEALERAVIARVDRTWMALGLLSEQLKVFETRLLADIDNELKISLEYYRFGKIEAYALIDLYRTFTASKLEYAKSLYLYRLTLVDLDVAGEDAL